MRKRGIIAAFAALLLILSLLFSSCTSGNDNKNSSPVIPDNTPEKESGEIGAKLLSDNSTLPAIPGDPYAALDADGLIRSGEGPFVLSDPGGGIEYALSGSVNIEDCVITGIKVLSDEYAICGMCVGDSPESAGMFFIGLGFSDLSTAGRMIYCCGTLSVEITKSENRITSFIITNQGGAYA